jgi:hypothetical protein
VRKVRGFNEAKVRWKIRKDVKEVEKSAAFVMEISSEGRPILIRQNHQPGVRVFAIVGPPQNFIPNVDGMVVSIARDFEKVILAELGLGRARPYHEAMRIGRRHGESYEVAGRHKWFVLNPEQYQNIAPGVFDMLRKIAFTKATNRKWGEHSCFGRPYSYSFLRKNWSGRKGKFISLDSSFRDAEHGTRFSVSIKDEYFLRDIFWAEKYLNPAYDKRVITFSTLLNAVVNGCGGDIKLIQEALAIPHGLLKHSLREVIIRLREKKHNRYWKTIAKMIGWENPETETAEQRLIRSVLPNPRDRFGDINLRITRGLDDGRDYISFNVFPSDFSFKK